MVTEKALAEQIKTCSVDQCLNRSGTPFQLVQNFMFSMSIENSKTFVRTFLLTAGNSWLSGVHN
jgi:hypothetical protein